MKKRLIFTCVVLMMCCVGFAQSFVLKGGIDFTQPDAKSPFDYKTGVGAQFGATYPIALQKNLYLEPGLMLAYHTWKFKDLVVEDHVGDMLAEKYDHKFKEWELSVPLYVNYQFTLGAVGCKVFTGPKLYYGLSNKLKTEVMIGGNDMGSSTDMFESGNGLRYNRLGLAWSFGAGVNLTEKLSLDFTASFGLTDMAKNASYSIHKSNLALTLGYAL